MRLSYRTAVAGALLTVIPAVSEAQVKAWSVPEGRVVVEGFLSRYDFGDERAAAGKLAGGGGRVLWAVASPNDSARTSIAQRMSVGAFAVRTSTVREGGDARASAWHMGTQVDLKVFSTPLAGRIDPIVSLGLGAFHETVATRPAWVRMPPLLYDPPTSVTTRLSAPAPRMPELYQPRTTTSASVTPAIGLRLHLAPNTSFRTDLRNVLLLRNGAQRGAELSAGIGVRL